MRKHVYFLLLLFTFAFVGCKSTSHSLVVVGEVTTGRLIPALTAGPEVHTTFVYTFERVAELPREE